MTNPTTDRTICDPQFPRTEKRAAQDLYDLIEIALALSMRLGHADAASYLFLASDCLQTDKGDTPFQPEAI